MKTWITTKCPRCGTINEYKLKCDPNFNIQHKVICDSQIGGCDDVYVVTISLDVIVKVTEAEEGQPQ